MHNQGLTSHDTKAIGARYAAMLDRGKASPNTRRYIQIVDRLVRSVGFPQKQR